MNDDTIPRAGLRPSTLLVHGGTERTPYGETSEAMFLTSGFVYDDAEQAEATFLGQVEHYQYSRFGNPTVAALERRLAMLEGAESCRATATGMAAVHAALLSHLKAGDRLVAARALFGSCHWIVANLLPRYGVETVFVDGADLAAWGEALSVPTACVLLETPSNPMLDMVDLRAVCELAHAAGAVVVVDNVFATPLLQHPLAFGADVVVYSCTKHIDGQGRVLGGAVLGSKAWIEGTLQPFVRNTGPAISPFNAWVLLKGLETLALRVDAMTRAAAVVAGPPGPGPRHRPGLVSGPRRPPAIRPGDAPDERRRHPGHVRGSRGGKPAAFRLMNALRLIAVSNNLGDSRSMVTHPATTTHMRIGAEERARLGITDGVIRLSAGLEDPHDIIDDLQRGLARPDRLQAAE